jgi:hypothetical protein
MKWIKGQKGIKRISSIKSRLELKYEKFGNESSDKKEANEGLPLSND